MTDQLDGPDTLPSDTLEPPKWPKVIGIISICWAALGLCCTGFGVYNGATSANSAARMGQMFPDGMPPEFGTVSASMWASMSLGAVGVLTLLTAGIVLLLRNPVARWLHLIYSTIALIGVVWGVMQQLGIMADINQWVQSNQSTKFAESWPTIRLVMWVTIGITISMSAIWPLFCAVWFGVVKRNPEEYSRGIEQLV